MAFVTINVDTGREDAAAEAATAWPSANMDHLWTDEAGVRACQVQFVPQRVLLAPDGSVAKWWDGSHGNVVDGKHGKSRGNASSHLADKIAEVLEQCFPAAGGESKSRRATRSARAARSRLSR